jgi:hypothetical protein
VRFEVLMIRGWMGAAVRHAGGFSNHLGLVSADVSLAHHSSPATSALARRSRARLLEPAVSLPPQFAQSIGLLAIGIVDPSGLKEASPERFLPARRKSIIWQTELPGNQLEARAAEAIKLIDDVDHASHI